MSFHAHLLLVTKMKKPCADIDKILEQSLRSGKPGRLAFGVGINDVAFKIGARFEVKKINHRAYLSWMAMLERCYSDKKLQSRPTYIECYVSKDWLLLSNFFAWWKENYVNGWHLDKDLLCPGNKEYRPDNCLYIPQWLNSFTNDHAAGRGAFPIGATFDKETGKFRAYVNIDGKKKNLGRFSDPYSAHNAWFEEKMKAAESYRHFCDSIHPHLYKGVIQKVMLIKEIGSK